MSTPPIDAIEQAAVAEAIVSARGKGDKGDKGDKSERNSPFLLKPVITTWARDNDFIIPKDLFVKIQQFIEGLDLNSVHQLNIQADVADIGFVFTRIRAYCQQKQPSADIAFCRRVCKTLSFITWLALYTSRDVLHQFGRKKLSYEQVVGPALQQSKSFLLVLGPGASPAAAALPAEPAQPAQPAQQISERAEPAPASSAAPVKEKKKRARPTAAKATTSTTAAADKPKRAKKVKIQLSESSAGEIPKIEDPFNVPSATSASSSVASEAAASLQ